MASRTLITGIARAISVNLTAPYAHQATDKAKYGVQLGYPQDGQVVIGGQLMCNTTWEDIFKALDEVCMEKWQQPFSVFQNPAMGVTYPPALADGNQKLAKDANKNPIPGQVDPTTAGLYLISAKNPEPVGCAGPDAKEITPSAIYRGCWVKVEIEAQAYETQAGNRVISLRLLNVMKCYDDERIGGGAQQQAASSAFANSVVANTNIAAGSDQQFAPVAPTVGHGAGVVAQPNPVVTAPVAPAQQAPVAPVAPPAQQAPVAPPAQQAPTAPVAPPAQQAPVAPPAQPTPVAPPAPAITTDPVIMNPGMASYAEMIAQGWTDELLISHGHGQANYTV